MTQRQLEVLKMKFEGMTQNEIAERLKTSRENISIILKRANSNIVKAKATLEALKTFTGSAVLTIRPGTHLVDIPRLILDTADGANIKVKANFTRIYEEIRFKAHDRVKQTKVVKPLTVRILPNGDFDVE